MKLQKIQLTLFLAILLVAVNSNATVIVSPTGATSTSQYGAAFGIGNTIDQSGLSIGFTSGVTDFDTYLGLNPMHNLAATTEWFSANNVVSATIDYDLGSILTLDRIAVWNEDAVGVGSIDVFLSTDNVLFTNVVNGLSPTNWPYSSNYPADVFGLGGSFNAQYVRLLVSGCPQPDSQGNIYCGLGEIAFSAAVPEPATLALLGAGLVGLGFSRRKKSA